MVKINSKSKGFRTTRALLFLALAPVTVPFAAWRYYSKRTYLTSRQVRTLDSYLWSSEHEEAYAKIVNIRRDLRQCNPAYFQLTIALAAYLAHVYNAEKALEDISNIQISKLSIDDQKKFLRIRALALSAAERTDEAHDLISSASWFGSDNQDLAVAASVTIDDEKKIEYFNKIFASSSMSPISKIHPDGVLRIDNIRSETPPCKVSNLGCVSVIFPIFNAEDTVEVAIKSILKQTYSNLELLLCNDCSNDRTPEILERLSKEDCRIKILTNEKNLGAYKTRNVGLKASTGEFVMVHDADDWSHPQRIEKHVSALQRDTALVACGSDWVRITPTFEVTSWRMEANPIKPSYPSFTVRRRVFEVLGDWDEVRISGDAEFIYRVKRHYGEKAVAWIEVGVPLALSLSSKASLTGNSATHVSSTRHGLRRYYHEAYKYRWRNDRFFDQSARQLSFNFLPKSIMSRYPAVEYVDRFVQADFRLPDAIENLRHMISKNKGRTAIMHVPEIVYKLPFADVFCDELFQMVEDFNVSVVHNKAYVDYDEGWAIFADGRVVKLANEKV